MTANSRVLDRTAHCNKQPAARPLQEDWRTSATRGGVTNFPVTFRYTEPPVKVIRSEEWNVVEYNTANIFAARSGINFA